MITIKDIARILNISPSTVSIVLRGEGEARKISRKTQQRIMETARKTGYTPNVQAKVLRGGTPKRMVVTLFWASDIRPYILSRFLIGLQESLIRHDYGIELQVCPYRAGHLSESMTDHAMLSTNGAVICNASDSDLAFLEEAEFPVPIVLYNRSSSKYPTVSMDDAVIGRLPAEAFLRHGCKRPAIVRSEAAFRGMDIRTDAFAAKMTENGCREPAVFTVTDTAEGGFAAGHAIAALKEERPDCLLCTSDVIAIGALKALIENGIRVPDQIQMISIGNGAAEFTAFSTPSVSIVELPMEEMADACLQRLHRAVAGMDLTPDSVIVPVRYTARESCPE